MILSLYPLQQKDIGIFALSILMRYTHFSHSQLHTSAQLLRRSYVLHNVGPSQGRGEGARELKLKIHFIFHRSTESSTAAPSGVP